MFDPGPEGTTSPYTAFRFQVELSLDQPVPGINGLVCRGAFSECDGLEMTMEPKAVREGGNNQEQLHLMGPISYGQLTLKRGMTGNRDLWNWFAAAGRTGRKSTANGKVFIADAAGKASITFVLENCLPVKLRGPSLNGKDGQIAIEEMQLVYSRLSIRGAGDAGAGMSLAGGFSVGGSADVTAGLSAGGGVGASASASASVSGGFGLDGGGLSASASASANASATAGLGIG
ncbi:MAG: phage tail protein [Ktedonobacteraceae bacterium]